MRVRVRDDVAKSKIVERASSRDRTKAREGLLRTATGSLQPDLPAKSSQFGTCRPTIALLLGWGGKLPLTLGVREDLMENGFGSDRPRRHGGWLAFAQHCQACSHGY